jgi:hypothetical protein
MPNNTLPQIKSKILKSMKNHKLIKNLTKYMHKINYLKANVLLKFILMY